jgi:hypothetical protein
MASSRLNFPRADYSANARSILLERFPNQATAEIGSRDRVYSTHPGKGSLIPRWDYISLDPILVQFAFASWLLPLPGKKWWW